ncbi:hypothetical protein FJY71_01260 [candidate division WOR-3 bacterium]|nr:hypothetical protein [candidate division WOR-3 bacterium]
MKVCHICGREVMRNRAGVVVHVEGGGVIWQRCTCGWNGSRPCAPTHCPRCNTLLRDDHVADEKRS